MSAATSSRTRRAASAPSTRTATSSAAVTRSASRWISDLFDPPWRKAPAEFAAGAKPRRKRATRGQAPHTAFILVSFAPLRGGARCGGVGEVLIRQHLQYLARETGP